MLIMYERINWKDTFHRGIDLSDKSVTTATTGDRTNNNNKLVYDYLIIALGAELAGIF
jgi:NADH dehydrogenase FAD-containing subunit